MLTEAEIKAIYVVRAAMEGLAGKLFALNATPAQCKELVRLRGRLDKEYRKGDIDSREEIKADFYRQLTEGAGNEILTENLRSFHARIAVFRRYAFVDPARIELSISELETIIEAAAVTRDPEAAWAACEHHIMLAGDLAVMEYSRRNRELFEEAEAARREASPSEAKAAGSPPRRGNGRSIRCARKVAEPRIGEMVSVEADALVHHLREDRRLGGRAPLRAGVEVHVEEPFRVVRIEHVVMGDVAREDHLLPELSKM